MAFNLQGAVLLGAMLPARSVNTTTQALNAANTWLSISHSQSQTKTLNKVKLRISGVTGSLAATDLQCEVYSDKTTATAGTPNASLASTTTVTVTPTGAIWVEFTGFSQSLTGGTRYHIVVKNMNASPASNFPTFTVGAAVDFGGIFAIGGPHSNGSPNNFGTQRAVTTDAGTNWTMEYTSQQHMRLEYSDGSFEGHPIQAMATDGGRAFGTTEVGVVLTTPPGCTLNVIGAVGIAGKNASPTGNCSMKLWTGSTPGLVATSVNAYIPALINTTLDYMCFWFDGVQAIAPETETRFTLKNSAADSSTNAYCWRGHTWENDADSLALKPFNGTLSKTVLSGGSWTDTDTDTFPFGLLLDGANPFTASGGSGGTRAYAA
jgi:hypothetical protein